MKDGAEQSGPLADATRAPGDPAGPSAETRTVILRAFLANVGIAAAKFGAAALTGSSAMLTEGVHSLVDTGNQALLWFGEKRAARPADALHPLGYARELYFWSFIVGMMIFAIGAGVSIYEGVRHVLHPEATRNPLIAYAVLALAFLLEGWSLVTAWREFGTRRGGGTLLQGIRRTKDTTSLVVLLEDGAAVAGVMVAGAGIGLELVTGNAVWDGVASIVIGLLLAAVSLMLLRESKDLLIGESADPAVVAGIRAMVEGADGIVAVGEVLTIHLGPDQVVAVIDVDFDNRLDVATMERVAARLEKAVRGSFAAVGRVYLRPIGGGRPDAARFDG